MYAFTVDSVIQATGRLPQAARRLDTGQWVLGLPNATVELQQACGWYAVTDTSRPADTDTATHDRTVELVEGTPTVVWTERPKTQAELDAEQAAAQDQAERDAIPAAARLAVIPTLDTLPDATVQRVAALFPAWTQPSGATDAYPLDVIVRHDGTLWRSTIASNVWVPGEANWHRYGASPDAGPQPWVQPSGATDAYPAGATVTHNGRTWENTHGDGNVWEPGVFGWADIGPA